MVRRARYLEGENTSDLPTPAPASKLPKPIQPCNIKDSRPPDQQGWASSAPRPFEGLAMFICGLKRLSSFHSGFTVDSCTSAVKGGLLRGAWMPEAITRRCLGRPVQARFLPSLSPQRTNSSSPLQDPFPQQRFWGYGGL